MLGAAGDCNEVRDPISFTYFKLSPRDMKDGLGEGETRGCEVCEEEKLGCLQSF